MNRTSQRLGGLLALACAAVALVALIAGVRWFTARDAGERGPVRVGILVATSGPRAAFDAPTLAGALAAIDLVNERGGVLGGRQLEAIVRDTAGEPERAAAEAKRLALDDRVTAIVGGTSSPVRRAAAAALVDVGGVLVSPSSAEGLDDHASLITLGSLPNQRIVPAVGWAVRTIGPRVLLLSDEGLTQRVVHAILFDHVPAVGGELVGEVWMKDGQGVEAALAAVREGKPDVVVSGLGRVSTEAFTRGLRSMEEELGRPATISWTLRFGELTSIESGLLDGDYLVASTFVDDVDERFLNAYRRRVLIDAGSTRPDARAAAAAGAIDLIARGVDRSGGVEPAGVRAAMLGARVEAPGGTLTIDPRTQAAWKTMRIGRIRGVDVEQVWASDEPIRPRPWPTWRTRAEWRALLADPTRDPRREELP